MESCELAKACAKVLSDKKASDIVIVNVGDQTVVCSYFVIVCRPGVVIFSKKGTLNGQTIKQLDEQLKQNEDVTRRNILILWRRERLRSCNLLLFDY